ncbi:MAG: hypothetical protein LBQ20_09145 [Rhodanobacter sp.]|jgi:hypothetical protein|nr:hypothetical protein [Rhodanobacter sp.]
MKKQSLSCALGGAAIALGLSLAGSAWAGSVTYPGPGVTLQDLSSYPEGYTDSLAPAGSASGKSSSLSGNTVTLLRGDAVPGDVYGAINLNDTAAISGNKVYINGDVGRWVNGGYLYYGDTPAADVSVSGNSVALDAGRVNAWVSGGIVVNADTGGATSTGNSVILTGAKVDLCVEGGNAHSGSGAATVLNNTVTIMAGTVSGIVWGGLAETNIGTAVASNNAVAISGGTLNGAVVGASAVGGAATASNNTVTISGTPVFGATTQLYGGKAFGGISTGNTLKFHSTGLTVGHLGDFQNLNFYLPTTLTPGDTLLAVTDTADITNATVHVSLDGTSGPTLHVGDTFTFIRAKTLNAAGITPLTGMIGGFTYTLKANSNQLVLRIDNPLPPAPTMGALAIGEGAVLALGTLFLAGLVLVAPRRGRYQAGA